MKHGINSLKCDGISLNEKMIKLKFDLKFKVTRIWSCVLACATLRVSTLCFHCCCFCVCVCFFSTLCQIVIVGPSSSCHFTFFVKLHVE
jgi:hypothetical protein